MERAGDYDGAAEQAAAVTAPAPAEEASAAAGAEEHPGGVDAWIPCIDPVTGRTVRRTLLMRAAAEGLGIGVLKVLLGAGASVTLASEDDGVTALHAAAACPDGTHALEAIKVLLEAGADRDALNHAGATALDVFLTKGLGAGAKEGAETAAQVPVLEANNSSERFSPPAESVPMVPANRPDPASAREVDTNSADFRMYRFKVDDCPYSDMLHDHDWTECPYAHPGEKARRRDPRKFRYTSTTCPDFRKGSCKRGEACPYAHGVFECWLHPSKYCTQLCKEAAACTRSICFFAHTLAELRTPPEDSVQDAALGSKRVSNSNLQAEDSWASFTSSNVEVACSSTSNSGPLGEPGAGGVTTAASVESVTSLLDKLKMHQTDSPPPVHAQPGSAQPAFTFASKTTTPFFTPPVSPACATRNYRNTMSPGLTPSYSPVSPQHGSPSRQRSSRMSTGGQGQPRSSAPSGRMTAPGYLSDATLLPQLLASLSPEQLALAKLWQAPTQQPLQSQSSQQQHKRQQQQGSHASRPAARQLATHNSMRAAVPQPQLGHQIAAQHMPPWTPAPDAAAQAAMLDLQSLAQLANTLFPDGAASVPGSWPLEVASLFGGSGGPGLMPAGHSNALEGLDVASQTFTMPPGNWSTDGTGIDAHNSFMTGNIQSDLLLQPAAHYMLQHR